MLRLSRSLSRVEPQDIKTQPHIQPLFLLKEKRREEPMIDLHKEEEKKKEIEKERQMMLH